MSRLRYVSERMPAFWASYLINGDGSGMEASEVAACDGYVRKRGIVEVAEVSSEPEFTWSFGLYGGDAEGGEVLEYRVRYGGVLS
jgi:hypothetical protein